MTKLSVRKAEVSDLVPAYNIIKECSVLLSRQGMDNWKRYTKDKVDGIIRSNQMFLLTDNDQIRGSIRISVRPQNFSAQRI